MPSNISITHSSSLNGLLVKCVRARIQTEGEKVAKMAQTVVVNQSVQVLLISAEAAMGSCVGTLQQERTGESKS